MCSTSEASAEACRHPAPATPADRRCARALALTFTRLLPPLRGDNPPPRRFSTTEDTSVERPAACGSIGPSRPAGLSACDQTCLLTRPTCISAGSAAGGTYPVGLRCMPTCLPGSSSCAMRGGGCRAAEDGAGQQRANYRAHALQARPPAHSVHHPCRGGHSSAALTRKPPTCACRMADSRRFSEEGGLQGRGGGQGVTQRKRSARACRARGVPLPAAHEGEHTRARAPPMPSCPPPPAPRSLPVVVEAVRVVPLLPRLNAVQGLQALAGGRVCGQA